jgi:hypothetical protein
MTGDVLTAEVCVHLLCFSHIGMRLKQLRFEFTLYKQLLGWKAGTVELSDLDILLQNGSFGGDRLSCMLCVAAASRKRHSRILMSMHDVKS